jgi:hypothetical protein
MAPQPVDWLRHGFVSVGNLTLLTNQWQAGKTTLLALYFFGLDRQPFGCILST